MIVVIFLWALVLFVFYVTGFSIARGIRVLFPIDGELNEMHPDEYFFLGFLIISVMAGFLSIFIPLGYMVLSAAVLVSILLFLLNIRAIRISLQGYIAELHKLTRWEIAFLIFLFSFILMAVVQKITLGDTESYHAQSIQWVRKYAVVPGLGNIHGRLAFNSMFLVISGLFTFTFKDILIFPLNGICYLVLTCKLFFLFKKENKPGTRWKAVFYILILLISLLILLPDLNSPAADIICSTLIIYTVILLMNLEEKESRLNPVQIILLNAVVFSCVSFKISSLFLVASLLFTDDKYFFKRIGLSVFIGILILSSFIIRNYYLSGYLIYPFPSIDIFNVDWKIPFGNALSEKFEIESWAKISTLASSDVIHMKLSEWVITWFHDLNSLKKLLVIVNCFSIISLVIMLFKKDYFLLKIQLILVLNLIFWFLNAPDPRFAFGFLFVGFSLNIAYLVRLFESETLYRFLRIGLICFLILIVGRRIMFPVDTLRHPDRWVMPEAFGTVATNEYFSDFHYRVPVPEGGCFNVEIPCVPYPLSGIELRNKDIQDGFRIKKITK